MVRYFRKKRVLVCFTVLLACFILLFIHRLCTSPKKPRVVVEQGDRVKYICNRILSSCNIIILTLDNEELVQFRCKIIPKLIEIPFRDARASHNGLCYDYILSHITVAIYYLRQEVMFSPQFVCLSRIFLVRIILSLRNLIICFGPQWGVANLVAQSVLFKKSRV